MDWRILAVAAAVLGGCGKEPAPRVDPGSRMEDAARQAGEAARQADAQKLGQAMAQMGDALAGGTKVEPVDFRELKELLPEALGSLKRVGTEGSRTNVMGIATAKALAVYEDGKGARLELELIDAGSLTGITALTFAWVNVDIDKEGDDGYERTTNLAGRKAFERYSRKARSGELDVLVAGRFVVTARGTGIEMKTFREAVNRVDLEKLDAMKSRGAPAPKK